MTGDDASPPESPESSPEARLSPGAWQPLTPHGVAAFAKAPLGRLLAVELAAALLAASVVIWFLLVAWFPVVREAIRRLPDTGEIRGQQLALVRPPSGPLASSRYLAIVIDLHGESGDTPDADLQVRFQSKSYELCSLLGCLELRYPRDYIVQFSRPELQPWWDAWQPFLLGSAAVAVVVKLFLLWGLLATVYCLPAWLTAWLRHQELTLGGGWKLASAALMPGALVLILGIVLYGVGALDLVHLAVVAALHVAMGWAYVVAGVLTLPQRTARPTTAMNPFAGPADA